ncbi:hypothetical protein OG252_00660 [Streptomyces sp. NBC_01352]|uniref:hypothetical protein n=1 Tax=unclassified Streptomyces TaxID=2593676 RepID=UPI002254E692|nr:MULTISPECIES: hypothetical protein [unclassified Streptomyces]MCX4706889.1 hypothetical protein [Streptomyces sp. NBC_01373]
MHTAHGDLLRTLRKLWTTRLVLNRASIDIAIRAMDIEDCRADIATVGMMALTDTDLVERVRTGAPPNTPGPATFHGGGEAYYDTSEQGSLAQVRQALPHFRPEPAVPK